MCRDNTLQPTLYYVREISIPVRMSSVVGCGTGRESGLRYHDPSPPVVNRKIDRDTSPWSMAGRTLTCSQ